MGPPLYMCSVIDWNIVIWHIPVLTTYKSGHTLQWAVQYVFSKTLAFLSKVQRQKMINLVILCWTLSGMWGMFCTTDISGVVSTPVFRWPIPTLECMEIWPPQLLLLDLQCMIFRYILPLPRPWQDRQSAHSGPFVRPQKYYIGPFWYDIFVNCSWVAIWWQQYSTHLHTHTHNTQNDTKQTINRTQKFWKSVGCAPS